MYGIAQNWQGQKGFEICQKEGKIFVCSEESSFSIIENVNMNIFLTSSDLSFQLGTHTRGKKKREEMQGVIAAMRKQTQH